MNRRGIIGRIYKAEYYTLLHTQYESSGPCGFGEKDFLIHVFSNCKSMEAIDPPGWGAMPFLIPGACLAGFM